MPATHRAISHRFPEPCKHNIYLSATLPRLLYAAARKAQIYTENAAAQRREAGWKKRVWSYRSPEEGEAEEEVGLSWVECEKTTQVGSVSECIAHSLNAVFAFGWMELFSIRSAVRSVEDRAAESAGGLAVEGLREGRLEWNQDMPTLLLLFFVKPQWCCITRACCTEQLLYNVCRHPPGVQRRLQSTNQNRHVLEVLVD